jgi:hypothetical protein
LLLQIRTAVTDLLGSIKDLLGSVKALSFGLLRLSLSVLLLQVQAAKDAENGLKAKVRQQLFSLPPALPPARPLVLSLLSLSHELQL